MDASTLRVTLLAGAALAAGFVDAISGGGGIITLPALLAAGVPPHVALGTNKLQSSLGTTIATANYARRGLLVRFQLPVGIVFTALGAFAGAAIATRLSSALMARVAPLLLVAVFVYAVRSPRLGVTAPATSPHRIGGARLAHGAFSAVAGSALGFYDGFFGPGAGSFWTIAFVIVLGFPLPQATANTKAMNLTSNLTALAWFAASGNVAWAVGLVMGAANVAGAVIGSSLAIERGARFIRVFFLLAVAATIVRLVAQSF
jgi:uncharacterized protein